MSYRPLALVIAVAALSSMHIGSAAAQPVYVAPGGVYVAPGAGPVYVTPSAPINGAAAYVDPRYGNGYETTAYVEPDSDYLEGPPVYVGPMTGPLRRRAQVWVRIRTRCAKPGLLQWTPIGLCGYTAATTARGRALSGWSLRWAALLKQYRPLEPI